MDIWRGISGRGRGQGPAGGDAGLPGCPPGAGGGPGGGSPPPASYTTEKRSGRGRPPPLLCGQHLLLAGPKATGKNVLAENLAAAFGRPSWDVSMYVNVDAASLVGADTLKDGEVVFREGPISKCARLGGFGVLDEGEHGQERGPGRPPRHPGLPAGHRRARV